MDPLGFADSMNLYETFGCDPVNKVDPRGTKAYPFDYAGSLPHSWDFRAPATASQEWIDKWNAFEEEQLREWFGTYDIAVEVLNGIAPTSDRVSLLLGSTPSKFDDLNARRRRAIEILV